MRNLKLTLQYDGTRYHGFQIQPNAETVQGTLEKSLTAITHTPVSITGCSRTDAGVHAVMYVCNFRTDFPIPADRLAIVLNNGFLKQGGDIKILNCCEVSENFNARFDTVSKTYRYIINNIDERDIFTRCYEWQYTFSELDVKKMREAAKYIVGTHDFTSFMTAGAQVKSAVRTVNYINIHKKGSKITVFINADGYVYNMVRIITGTLVQVGEGKIKPSEIKNIIKMKDRSYAGPTAPPQGLSLYEVFYREEH